MIKAEDGSVPPLSRLRDDPTCFTQDIPGPASASWQPAAHESPSVNSHIEDQTNVILPYAIEEPEDEPADAWEEARARPRSALLLHESSDPKQDDLADSMEGLCCDSDPTSRRSSFAAKRGMKRKPSSAPTAPSHPTRSHSTSNSSNNQEGGSNGRPKRQRRRSQRSKNHMGLFSDVLWHGEASETGSSGSYDSRSSSADPSSSHPYASAALDQMDID
ncbi:hypothetical protein BO82DRAFT_13443 [Aspergillus uvarum CBS 121591]|uniref:Uncharacterized protein n=1 Tax=Aspergillus uvarum CBS 121591 TaxID=1448315 RepID=A0A319CB82_9EURO|nr:hypothetical protein BO82DRAFT_13443 [Aspergillus uvarum CBS 121591]PYH75763.1 hypothetical protein BO82DRAFT_13443 [Aspergillus uvarum CBS 121591]